MVRLFSFTKIGPLKYRVGNYGSPHQGIRPHFQAYHTGLSRDRLDTYEEDYVVTNSDKRWRHGCRGVYRLIIVEYDCRKLINEN